LPAGHGSQTGVRRKGSAEALALLPDLEHDLATCVCRPATRPNASRTRPNGRTASTCGRSCPEATIVESASSRCRPPVCGERFARDAPLELERTEWGITEIARPPSRTAPTAWSTLTTDAIDEQVDAAGDYG
jgi:hypothetical protein